MKLSWFTKELISVITILVFSIAILILATLEFSGLSNQYFVFVVGIFSGIIPIIYEVYIAHKNGSFFLKNKDAIAAKKAKNAKITKSLLALGAGFGLTFALFPDLIRLFLLSAAAGYLLPFSLLLLIHFLKNHKEIEKIAKDL